MKKKVLFVAYNTFNRGGVQNVVMNIVKNLSDEYTFDLLCFQEDKGAMEEEFLSYGGKIIKYPTYYAGPDKFRKRLDYYIRGYKIFEATQKAIKENGPYQVIHCNNGLEGGLCSYAARIEKVPIRIVHSHANFCIHKNFFLKILEHLYGSIMKSNTSYRIGCSKEACSNLFGNVKDTIVERNPYDDNKFKANNYGTKYDCPCMIQVASYNENKNQLFSIYVLNEIKKNFPDTKLLFVGYETENGYLEKMKNEIRKLNLQENISFYSSDADIPLLMSATPYFIFPSMAEGFGLAPVEAQAMGLRCFVSDSVPHLCDCGGCEFLPLKDGYEFWADEIMRDFKKSKGEHKKYNCAEFSMHNVSQQYRELYQGYIEKC